MNKQSAVFLLISASILSSSCGKKDAVHTTTHSIQPGAPTSYTTSVSCSELSPGILAVTVVLNCSDSLKNATIGFNRCTYQLGDPSLTSTCSYTILNPEPISTLCATSGAGNIPTFSIDCVTCADIDPLPFSLVCG